MSLFVRALLLLAYLDCARLRVCAREFSNLSNCATFSTEHISHLFEFVSGAPLEEGPLCGQKFVSIREAHLERT